MVLLVVFVLVDGVVVVIVVVVGGSRNGLWGHNRGGRRSWVVRVY